MLHPVAMAASYISRTFGDVPWMRAWSRLVPDRSSGFLASDRPFLPRSWGSKIDQIMPCISSRTSIKLAKTPFLLSVCRHLLVHWESTDCTFQTHINTALQRRVCVSVTVYVRVRQDAICSESVSFVCYCVKPKAQQRHAPVARGPYGYASEPRRL